MLDVFISYSRADERWATWIAGVLESAGYRTMIQVWDFVPGSNFVEFIDRGISESTLVLAVLSRNYLQSRYGRIEWQAAWRVSEEPGAKLVTVRVEDCELTGLLATITYLDLVAIEDAGHARELLLQRIQEAGSGRAKPPEAAPFPPSAPAVSVLPPSQQITRSTSTWPDHSRRAAVAPYPAAARPTGARAGVSVLHVRGLGLHAGPGDAAESEAAVSAHAQILGDVTQFVHAGAPDPDLIVVSGDLTATGGGRSSRPPSPSSPGCA